MGKLNVTRVIAFVMIATFATSFMTACGDGKNKRRAKNSRTLNDKPVGADDGTTDDGTQDTAPGDTPPGDTTTGDQTTDGDKTTVNQDQDAIKKKGEALKSIEDAMAALSESGTMVDKNGLEEGKYKLTHVASSIRYIFKQEDARGMQVLDLNEVGDSGVQLKETSTNSAGVVADHQLAGRDVEIALSFEVKKENGVYTAARTSFSPAILKTSVSNQMNVSTSLSDSSVDASPIASSMIDMLKGSAQGTSDITYSMTDENNRTLIMRMRKVSETELHVVIRVDEELAKDGDANTYTSAREIVLTYSFEKAAAQQDNTLVLTQPEEPTAPPTTTTTTTDEDDLG